MEAPRGFVWEQVAFGPILHAAEPNHQHAQGTAARLSSHEIDLRCHTPLTAALESEQDHDAELVRLLPARR